MDGSGVEQLDRAALIVLLLEQRTVIERLTVRIGELEAELAQYRQPPKTAENSSVPPSQGRKANRAERRGGKRGARRGHVGSSRRRQTPDTVVKVRPTACGGCGAALSPRDQRRVGKSQTIELPPVRPVVIELWRYAAVCPGCQHRTVAAAPAGLEPTRTFGPEIEARLGYPSASSGQALHERHHLSYGRLVEASWELFGLKLSEGAIANALGRLAEQARPTYEAIGAEVRASPVLGSDETGARLNGRTVWEWVFQTPTASYHPSASSGQALIAPTRGGQVIDEFLAGAQPEVWISDLAPAQLGTAAVAHQVCLAHQLRDLHYAAEADDTVGLIWAVALQRVFRRGIHLHHQWSELTPEQFARRRTLIENAAHRLIFQAWAGSGEAGRLQRRYAKHWQDPSATLRAGSVRVPGTGQRLP